MTASAENQMLAEWRARDALTVKRFKLLCNEGRYLITTDHPTRIVADATGVDGLREVIRRICGVEI